MGHFQIVKQLPFVYPAKSVQSFQFDNDLVKANKVGNILLLQRLTFVLDCKLGLGLERQASSTQFDLERFLVKRFKEPAAKLILNIHRCANDFINFFLED